MARKLQRLESIVNLLKLKNGANVKDLAEKLHVSEMTVRRDLKSLEEEGMIVNMYGSAVLNPNSRESDIFNNKDHYLLFNESVKNLDCKIAIGQYAASLIEDGDTIILDAGTTTNCLAKSINKNLKLKVTCVTANVLSTFANCDNFTIIFPGGYFHHNTQMVESDEGVKLISQTRANKVFISAAGIHEKLGVTCANNYEINTKKACIASGAEVILIADSSKFSTVKTAYFADLDAFTTVITDDGISKEWEEILKERNIKLHKVIVDPATDYSNFNI